MESATEGLCSLEEIIFSNLIITNIIDQFIIMVKQSEKFIKNKGKAQVTQRDNQQEYHTPTPPRIHDIVNNMNGENQVVEGEVERKRYSQEKLSRSRSR